MILLSTALRTYGIALQPIFTLTLGDLKNLLHRVAEITSWRTSFGKARLEVTVSFIPRCWPRKGNTSHRSSHGECRSRREVVIHMGIAMIDHLYSATKRGSDCVCVTCMYDCTLHWGLLLQQLLACVMVHCSSVCDVLPLTVIEVAPAYTAPGVSSSEMLHAQSSHFGLAKSLCCIT